MTQSLIVSVGGPKCVVLKKIVGADFVTDLLGPDEKHDRGADTLGLWF
jgi:hypothetical protein